MRGRRIDTPPTSPDASPGRCQDAHSLWLTRRGALAGGLGLLSTPVLLPRALTKARAQGTASTGAAPTSGLIPRQVLFGNPERSSCQISYDGHMLSWLAPRDGVLNVWVTPVDDLAAARCITDDKGRGISSYAWSVDGRHIIYGQDQGGDENFHIYATDVASGTTRDLTPMPGVAASVAGRSLARADLIAVLINDRDKRWHDLWTVEVSTGKRTLVLENTAGYASIEVDDGLVPAIATRLGDGGEPDLVYRLDRGKPEVLRTVPKSEDQTSGGIGLNRKGDIYYFLSAEGRDKAALVAIDMATGKERRLAEHAKADITGVERHPTTLDVLAATAVYHKSERIFLSPSYKEALGRLERELGAAEDDIAILDQTLDDNTWVVGISTVERRRPLYLYDSRNGRLRELFLTRPKLSGYQLAAMYPEVIRARDGLELVSYLTLPKGIPQRASGRPATPVPLVLNVHGGPWARDTYGYDGEHQWLADRGYAVLAVNFRGSTGFGKAFVNAGDREWGARMHDDLLDAVAWAVREGIAPKDRIAIMGASYGGYATLAGMAFTPEVFCCGIDVVGISNLETFLKTVPPYWEPAREMLNRRVGEIATEEGRAFLRARSPLYKADQITKPLLIAQGANDPRVVRAESEQIVAAMKGKKLPVTYVLYPDEGHGFQKPENSISFYAVAEAFLARHLGGAVEAFGADLAGSSLTVPEGGDLVPGLAAALAKKP